MYNTEPGVNRWRAVQERPTQRSATAFRPPPEAFEVQRGRTSRPSPWLNTDPRLDPDRTGLYWEAKQPCGSVRPASAGAPSHQHRLGAAVACGYGRAPTATVHTSAGTAVPTTDAQSPLAMRDGGRGRLQAYAFSPAGFLGHGSFLGGSTSASAPASPLDRRTLLYTRTAAGGTAGLAVAAGGWGAPPQRHLETQHPEPLPQRLLPATDLLDRLALLRRLAPATDPAPRPPQLQGMQGGRAAQAWAAYTTPAAHPAPQQPACGGVKRWAWDDSLVSARSSGGRPLTAGPAPGWQYCGELLEPQPDEGLSGSTAAALVSTGGAQAALLVVNSPRQHQLCLDEEEGEEGARWHATDPSASHGSRRTAFRPPGPLKHKFGNKPQPRPRSAPGGGEGQARVPGLRDCGCPKSPRASGVPAAGPARRSGSCTARQHQPTASRRHLSWADAAPEAPAPAAPAAPMRPRSAGLAVATAAPRRPALRQRLHDSSAETEHAIPEPASPRLTGGNGVREGTGRQGADSDMTTVEVTTGEGTTTDVVVVSSPRIASGLGEDEMDVLTVAVQTSPTHGSARGSEVVVVQQRSPSPPPQPARPRQAPAEVTAAPGATCLTVSLPSDGRHASYSIRADASSAAAAGSASGSPIKAWRPAQQVQQAQQPQQVTVSVDVLASPPRHAPAQRQARQAVQEQRQRQPAAPVDHLQQLAGEIRRREQSFNSLLAELEAIQQKCAKLSGPACAKAPAAVAAAGAAAAAAAPSSGVGLPRPRSGKKALSAAGQAGRGSSTGDRDWSWQSLMDFEATIREQQRKLVEQGVLPPDYL